MARTNSLSRAWIGSVCILLTYLSPVVASLASAAEPTNPLLREFSITVDPSALNPPTWWHVPGITPLIWTKDPINMDAYKTTQIKELKLKPGDYRFGTFTFDFLFKVTLAGTLEFAKTLDQCVNGRGSGVLTIHCSHTQPYPQDPDYPK
ncbi:MAG: hypothetical protein OET79_06040 [Nitrospirota bacterium]|nr:hypothetical protein [Nitrospirota bacterium]